MPRSSRMRSSGSPLPRNSLSCTEMGLMQDLDESRHSNKYPKKSKIVIKTPKNRVNSNSLDIRDSYASSVSKSK